MGNPGFGVAWTDAEDAAIRARYAKDGADVLARELGRTRGSVFKRAGHLGVKKRQVWTCEEDGRLTRLWGDRSVSVIAKKLGRSPLTVYWRANKIGLPLGCPQGFEYVLASAKRTGFAYETLIRIVEWAKASGVFPGGEAVIRRAMTRPTKGGSYYRRIVDPQDVDDAVAAWMQTETIQGASERRGLDNERLRQILLTYGDADLPAPPAYHQPWRVLSETIDAAVAKWRARETLTDAAKRVGVRQETLALRLRAAGAAGIDQRPWQLVPAEVDRVAAEARAA